MSVASPRKRTSMVGTSTGLTTSMSTPIPSRRRFAPYTPSRDPIPAGTPPSRFAANTPFDWEAAKGHRPPPYGDPSAPSTPLREPGEDRVAVSRKRERVYRKVPLWERIKSAPQDLWFKIELLPETAPLPSPKKTGRAVAVLCHLLHLLAKWNAMKPGEATDGWEDMTRELGNKWEEEKEGFSWSTPIVFLLVLASTLNVLYAFTRVKSYNLHFQPAPVSSPHVRLVKASDITLREPPSISQQIGSALYRLLRAFWYFLLGKTPTPTVVLSDLHGEHVQQLNVWSPGDFEIALLSIYSPAHCLVWMIFSSQTWILSLILMGVLTALIQGLIYSYEALIKDKAIIAAEVLHEYDTRFVNPRLHTVKKDACVMTHEAEMVDYHRRW